MLEASMETWQEAEVVVAGVVGQSADLS